MLGESEVSQRKVTCVSVTKAPVTGGAGRPGEPRHGPRHTELAVAEREAVSGGIHIVTDTRGLCRAQHWVWHQTRGSQPCSQ